MNRNSKRLLAVGLPFAAVAVCGVAFAAWTATGVGSGTATATTSLETSTVGAGTSVADLYPGAAKTVTVKITNHESFPAIVTYIPVAKSVLVNTSCAVGSVYTVALGTVTGATALTPVGLLSATIPVGESREYSVQTRMIGDAAEACKSQTFTLSYGESNKVQLLSAATTAP
jgi:hypothetical protein